MQLTPRKEKRTSRRSYEEDSEMIRKTRRPPGSRRGHGGWSRPEVKRRDEKMGAPITQEEAQTRLQMEVPKRWMAMCLR